jgi:hypothetical protein
MHLGSDAATRFNTSPFHIFAHGRFKPVCFEPVYRLAGFAVAFVSEIGPGFSPGIQDRKE